jgi:dCTP diphosphatase
MEAKNDMSMGNILKRLVDFRNARGWHKVHIEPELARSLMIEAAELNELYQWGQEPTQERLAEEVADVLIYALYLCEARDLDPEEIIHAKIDKNGLKYPL